MAAGFAPKMRVPPSWPAWPG